MTRQVLVASVVFLLAAGGGAAFTRTTTPAKVTFKAIMKPGGAFEGTTPDLVVKDTGDNVRLIVALQNLDTGMSLRNKHMKEKYLEADKFPVVVLEVAKAALKIPADGAAAEGDATGAFTLHGVKKDVKLSYKGRCDAAGVCDVEGNFDINFNDFGVQVPSYLGVTVKPETAVSAKFQVKRDPPPPVAPAPPAPPAPPAAPAP